MWSKPEETYPKKQEGQTALMAKAALGSEKKQAPPPVAGKPGFWFIFLGILVPSVAILFEHQTHFCARHFFDPLPSILHVFLVSLIPFTASLIYLSSRSNLSSFYAPITLLAGMAMGVAFMYSVMFLPLMPLCLMWSLALGFGLLGLSPFLSMFCLWRGGGSLCHIVNNFGTFFCPHQVKHLGHLVILALVLVIEFPSTITRVYLQMAAKPETQAQGIKFLRQYGSEEVMLRACYERSGRATDILGSLCEFSHPLKVNEARDIFYKVTGKPFNSVPIPKSFRATIAHAGVGANYGALNAGVQDEFDIDTDIAGEMVSSFARGLTAQNSQMTGTVDADAGVAELSWYFTFKNSSQVDREARTKILLPHGAVITDASIWVNGVERKAEIQLRQAARSAYTAAVHSRKSPLLVSLSGPDTILVQCYPVTNTSDLRVKLNMAAPLTLDKNKNGVLSLPSFEERNFQVEGTHKLELDSAKSMTAGLADLHAASKTGGRSYLTGEIKGADLYKPQAMIHVERDKQYTAGSFADAFQSGAVIQSKVVEVEATPPKGLKILIDGSASMAPYIEEVKEALRALPPNVPTEIVFGSDETQHLCPAQTLPADPAFQQAVNSLSAKQCEGGQDSLSALAMELNSDLGKSANALLWIHGPQPLALSVNNRLDSIIRYGGHNSPHIYDLQVAPGPNVGLDGIFDSKVLSSVPKVGSVADDLRFLFLSWSHQQKTPVLSLSKFNAGDTGNVAAETRRMALPALAQVWAYKQTLAAMPHSTQPINLEALRLASIYHIVSPVSSAVVVDDERVARRVRHRSRRNSLFSGFRFQNPLSSAISSSFGSVSGQLNQLAGQASQGIGERSSQLSQIEPQSSELEMQPRRGGWGSDSYSAGDAGVQSSASPEMAAGAPASAPAFGDYRSNTTGSINGFADKPQQALDGNEKKEAMAGNKAMQEMSEIASEEDVAGADDAPEASAVPEADTWLLLGAVALVFGVVVLRNKLRVRRV